MSVCFCVCVLLSLAHFFSLYKIIYSLVVLRLLPFKQELNVGAVKMENLVVMVLQRRLKNVPLVSVMQFQVSVNILAEILAMRVFIERYRSERLSHRHRLS